MICTQIFSTHSSLYLRNETEILFDIQLFADGEKTEEPTPKKRSDARNKGQVARSQELNAAFVLLAGFFVIDLLWENIYANIAAFSSYIFSNLGLFGTSTEAIMGLLLEIISLLAKTSFPIMIGIMILALGINIYQVGFVISTQKLEFNLNKLD